MSSTLSSNDNHGDRNQITTQEAQNNNQPLDWEPIKNAQDAENLMKQKYGDQGWYTVHGSVGTSYPIYFAETNNNGQKYYVLATGQITQDENDIKPNNDTPWTLDMVGKYYINMINRNGATPNSLLPDYPWPSPVNGQKWKEYSNTDKEIKFGVEGSDKVFILTNNGNGTSTFDYGDGKLLATNSGLKSRFPNVFHFEDYTAKEVSEIGIKMLKKDSFKFNHDLYQEVVQKQYEFSNNHSNGRWIRNTNEKLERIVAKCVMNENSQNMDIITDSEY